MEIIGYMFRTVSVCPYCDDFSAKFPVTLQNIRVGMDKRQPVFQSRHVQFYSFPPLYNRFQDFIDLISIFLIRIPFCFAVSVSHHIINMSKHIEIRGAAYIFQHLHKRSPVYFFITFSVKKRPKRRIFPVDHMQGAYHKVKRVLLCQLCKKPAQMGLHSKFYPNPYIQPVSVFFPKRFQYFKIFFYIENAFLSPSEIVLVIVICKADHLQPLFDGFLYHLFRSALRIMGKGSMHVYIRPHFLSHPY